MLDTFRRETIFHQQPEPDLEQRVADLEAALESSRTIGTAVGIVMHQYGLHQDAAFAYLTRLSQHRNVKVRVIAASIVDEANQQAQTSPPNPCTGRPLTWD
jgi:AmiR/NasT family two-component response regulator